MLLDDETGCPVVAENEIGVAAPGRGASGNVLVLGDDMRIFLSVTRALGRTGKRVHAVPTDLGSPALRSRYLHRVHAVTDFASDPGAWREAIARIVREFAIDLIIPCTDPAIIALQQCNSSLGEVAIAIPAADAMEMFFDKEETHEVCSRLSIPVLDAARLDVFENTDGLIGRFGLPVVVKPLRSFWADELGRSEKVHIVENSDQLEKLFSTILRKDRFLVEQFFEGSGVGVSVLADRGRIVQAFQHRRLREGKGGCSSYRVSETVDPAMLEACARLCSHSRHHGVCMFEFRRNRASGEWILLEVNCRFWGSMPLPTALGVDFPNKLYDLLVLDKCQPATPYMPGVRSRNHVLDGFNLVKRFREGRLPEYPSLALEGLDYAMQPLRWITGAETNDSIVRDDLAPGFAEAVSLPFSLARKLRVA